MLEMRPPNRVGKGPWSDVSGISRNWTSKRPFVELLCGTVPASRASFGTPRAGGTGGLAKVTAKGAGVGSAAFARVSKVSEQMSEVSEHFIVVLPRRRAEAPNDLKLSDSGGRRGTCTVGGKAAVEAGAVTHGAVR